MHSAYIYNPKIGKLRQKDIDFTANNVESSTRLVDITCSILAHPGMYTETLWHIYHKRN